MEKKKSGRYSLLAEREDIIPLLTEAVELGMSDKAAADFAGVCYESFYNWKSQGKEDFEKNKDSLYADLYFSIKKARGKFIQKNAEKIKKIADKGNWQASAWLLERRAPEDYALQQKVDMNAQTSVIIVNDVSEKD